VFRLVPTENEEGRVLSSVKRECLSKLIIFGPNRLWRVSNEYSAHYQGETESSGKEHMLLFSKAGSVKSAQRAGPVPCKQRLGGLLKY